MTRYTSRRGLIVLQRTLFSNVQHVRDDVSKNFSSLLAECADQEPQASKQKRRNKSELCNILSYI